MVDGAGYWRIYWSVILPLSRPILSVARDPVLPRQLERLPLAADRHRRRQALGRAGRHRQLQEPVLGVLELHHGGLDHRRRADARALRDLPEADHGIHQDQRPQVAAASHGGTDDHQLLGPRLDLSNLYRLSDAKTRSISPGELHRREGQGRHGDRGHRRHRRGRATLGPGLEGLALDPHRAGRDPRARRHRGPGRDPADLDDHGQPALARPRSCASTGTTRRHPSVECPLGDFFGSAGTSSRRSPRSPSASTPAGLQLLLGDAVPQARPASRSRTATRTTSASSTTRSTTR